MGIKKSYVPIDFDKYNAWVHVTHIYRLYSKNCLLK